MIREANRVEHSPTRPGHPWSKADQTALRWAIAPTDGQVARLHRTIKEATARRFYPDSHAQRRTHLADLVAACSFAQRLEIPGDPTPCEYICKLRASEPDSFTPNPISQMPKLNV